MLQRGPLTGLVVAVALGAGLSACGGPAAGPATQPLSPGPATSRPDPVPADTVAPSAGAPTTPPPATATGLEVDPAVVALRAYLRAASRALNAGGAAAFPELVAVSTTAQQVANPAVLASGMGGYEPGPTPFAPLAVDQLSGTERVVTGCALTQGWTLDAAGGPPLAGRVVSPIAATAVLEADTWKIDAITADDDGRCAGVTIPEVLF